MSALASSRVSAVRPIAAVRQSSQSQRVSRTFCLKQGKVEDELLEASVDRFSIAPSLSNFRRAPVRTSRLAPPPPVAPRERALSLYLIAHLNFDQDNPPNRRPGRPSTCRRLRRRRRSSSAFGPRSPRRSARPSLPPPLLAPPAALPWSLGLLEAP